MWLRLGLVKLRMASYIFTARGLSQCSNFMLYIGVMVLETLNKGTSVCHAQSATYTMSYKCFFTKLSRFRNRDLANSEVQHVSLFRALRRHFQELARVGSFTLSLAFLNQKVWLTSATILKPEWIKARFDILKGYNFTYSNQLK